MKMTPNPLPPESIHSILLRGTNWIGDAVMTLPAVASIRAAYPDARLAVLAKPPVSELYQMFTDADEVIVYDKRFDHPLGVFSLANHLRKMKFDAAILLQNAIEAAIISRVAGIRYRAGYNTDGRGFLLTHPIRRTRDILGVHQIDYYLEMVQALGAPPADRHPHLQTRISASTACAVMRQHLGDEEPIIGIAPGATYGPAKRWFAERFADVADRLADTLSARVVLFGGKDDEAAVEAVRRAGKHPFVSLAGKTSLHDAIYLISQCRVFVSNDSGLMHVAGALNVPTVAVFGSTNPVTTSPVGDRVALVRHAMDCSPCLKKVCPTDFRCMEAVTADEVWEAARNLLAEK